MGRQIEISVSKLSGLDDLVDRPIPSYLLAPLFLSRKMSVDLLLECMVGLHARNGISSTKRERYQYSSSCSDAFEAELTKISASLSIWLQPEIGHTVALSTSLALPGADKMCSLIA